MDGVNVLSNQTFQWENNGGALYMELGNLATGTKVDNLSVRTIPEPSTLGLLSVATLALSLARRRR